MVFYFGKKKILSPLTTSAIKISYANVTRVAVRTYQTICHRERPFGMYVHAAANRPVYRSNFFFIRYSCTLNTRQHPVNRRRRLGRHNFSGNPKANTRCYTANPTRREMKVKREKVVNARKLGERVILGERERLRLLVLRPFLHT